MTKTELPEVLAELTEFAAKCAEQPKGPFRPKNTTALNSIVFYYCRSFFVLFL